MVGVCCMVKSREELLMKLYDMRRRLSRVEAEYIPLFRVDDKVLTLNEAIMHVEAWDEIGRKLAEVLDPVETEEAIKEYLKRVAKKRPTLRVRFVNAGSYSIREVVEHVEKKTPVGKMIIEVLKPEIEDVYRRLREK